jgi:hypothetical protein
MGHHETMKKPVDVAGEIMKISLRCRVLPEKDRRSPDEIPGYGDKGLPQ